MRSAKFFFLTLFFIAFFSLSHGEGLNFPKTRGVHSLGVPVVGGVTNNSFTPKFAKKNTWLINISYAPAGIYGIINQHPNEDTPPIEGKMFYCCPHFTMRIKNVTKFPWVYFELGYWNSGLFKRHPEYFLQSVSGTLFFGGTFRENKSLQFPIYGGVGCDYFIGLESPLMASFLLRGGMHWYFTPSVALTFEISAKGSVITRPTYQVYSTLGFSFMF